MQAGRWYAAERAHQQALEIREVLARDHPDNPRDRTELAQAYESVADAQEREGRRPASSIRSRLHAIALRESLVRDDPEDPRRLADLAADYTALQWHYHEAGRLDLAAQAAQQALDLWERLQRAGVLDVLSRGWFLGDRGAFLGEFLTRLGRPDEALRAYQRAREQWEAVLKEERPGEMPAFRGLYADCLTSIGRLHARAGRLDEAARALEQARGLLDRVANTGPSGAWLALALSQTAALIGAGRVELTDAEGAERAALAGRAVALLRWAIDHDGYKHLRFLEASPTFDVLRPRPDFQLLLYDLAFPAWPFPEDPP